MTASEARSRTLAVRLWLACLATQELITVYLGLRLGLYDCLARGGPATPDQLADRAGIAHRYAREWLEQQAVAGILETDGAAGPETQVYRLPAGHRTVLTASDSPLSVGPMTTLPVGGVAGALPRLIDAFRTGDGVPDSVYGDDWRAGHAGANRALFVHDLPRWIRESLPDLHSRLLSRETRVADLACGAGWSSLALARMYPQVTVDGFDVDPVIVGMARRNALDQGLAERVSFDVRDVAATDSPAGGYDLICLFDALHEMPRPVDVLQSCRRIRSPEGTVLVMDARVADTFTAPADEVERFQYATSVLHCLPVSLTNETAGTGTVLRPFMLRELALAAGFSGVAVTGVKDRFHRLYRLIG